jgi:hypothetical protein
MPEDKDEYVTNARTGRQTRVHAGPDVQESELADRREKEKLTSTSGLAARAGQTGKPEDSAAPRSTAYPSTMAGRAAYAAAKRDYDNRNASPAAAMAREKLKE